jgi:uncharacterized membrane protein YgcG
MTTKIPTGNKICTTRVIPNGVKNWGGDGLEDSLGTEASTGTEYEEVCVDEYTTATSLNENVQEAQVEGETVHIGKVLMFINLDRSRLTVDSNEEATFASNMDMGGFTITNVAGLSSASGLWSINAEGDLIVQTIRTEKAFVGESLEVGSEERPRGITIFDTVTGEPYCLQMAAGVMASEPGRCEIVAETEEEENNDEENETPEEETPSEPQEDEGENIESEPEEPPVEPGLEESEEGGEGEVVVEDVGAGDSTEEDLPDEETSPSDENEFVDSGSSVPSEDGEGSGSEGGDGSDEGGSSIENS